jgi:hypothetical protein
MEPVMSSDQISFIVTQPEETRAKGSPASSPIPTLGAAATAVDLYRILGVSQSNLDQISIAFTDVASVAALSKIAEGNVSSYQEIAAAETALQAILLHDIVHVVVPSPKIQHSSGVISYLRPDNGVRTPFGFDLFSLAGSRDFLIAPEFIHEYKGKIKRSTLKSSVLVGKAISNLQGTSFNYSSGAISDAVNATVQEFGVPIFISDESTVRRRRGDGFSKLFYERLGKSWDEVTQGIPPVFTTIELPPLLAVVLDRLNNRADLKSVIAELRNDTKAAREELFALNSIPLKSFGQAEVERQTHRFIQSIDAIISQSRLSNAERTARKLYTVQKIVTPIFKMIAALAQLNGVDVISNAKDAITAITESGSVVDRTITARTFANLMKTDSLQLLAQQHFTSAEIGAIERSMTK